jgi:hypothetical protein
MCLEFMNLSASSWVIRLDDLTLSTYEIPVSMNRLLAGLFCGG